MLGRTSCEILEVFSPSGTFGSQRATRVALTAPADLRPHRVLQDGPRQLRTRCERQDICAHAPATLRKELSRILQVAGHTVPVQPTESLLRTKGSEMTKALVSVVTTTTRTNPNTKRRPWITSLERTSDRTTYWALRACTFALKAIGDASVLAASVKRGPR
jgi:hypothetical protein